MLITYNTKAPRIICLFLSAGDESQVNLAIVQASSKDSGVYRCTIANEYGTDSTDCLLSAESMYPFTFGINKHFPCITGPQQVSSSLSLCCSPGRNVPARGPWW